MGGYKTVYRIRLRVFWSSLRFDVSDWVEQCSHCMLTYFWRRSGKILMFFFSISSPFTTVYIELWMPDHRIDKNGYMILINVMCDISQFVVVVSATDESSATLAFYLCNTF